MVMKKVLLCALAGALLSVTSVSQANDGCCQKSCFSLPKLCLPKLKLPKLNLWSHSCEPKSDPCAPHCAAPASATAPAPVPAPPQEAAPAPKELSPSAAETPKK
jgi:hypothetical protein